MDMRFVTRGTEVSEEHKSYMQGKLSKLEKFFSKILDNQVVVSFGRGVYNVEITSNANGVIMRGEDKASDMRKAFDKALKNIERQIKRHKSFLTDRAQLKTHDISFNIEGMPQEVEPQESTEEIVKTKKFSLRPMTPKEAVMHMDLLGHEFYVFRNVETASVNVVYKRKSGGFGLIEPNE